MSVVLDREFATAEDTAAVLGVSRKRLKRLMRLAGPEARIAENGSESIKTSKSGRFTNSAATAKRKKQTRGKTKKAAH